MNNNLRVDDAVVDHFETKYKITLASLDLNDKDRAYMRGVWAVIAELKRMTGRN